MFCEVSSMHITLFIAIAMARTTIPITALNAQNPAFKGSQMSFQRFTQRKATLVEICSEVFLLCQRASRPRRETLGYKVSVLQGRVLPRMPGSHRNKPCPPHFLHGRPQFQRVRFDQLSQHQGPLPGVLDFQCDNYRDMCIYSMLAANRPLLFHFPTFSGSHCMWKVLPGSPSRLPGGRKE